MATQGIKLDDQTTNRLRELAAQKGRTPHWLMKTAIDQYLENEERYEREKAEDEAVWQEYVTTGKGHTLENVKPWLEKLMAGKAVSWEG